MEQKFDALNHEVDWLEQQFNRARKDANALMAQLRKGIVFNEDQVRQYRDHVAELDVYGNKLFEESGQILVQIRRNLKVTKEQVRDSHPGTAREKEDDDRKYIIAGIDVFKHV